MRTLSKLASRMGRRVVTRQHQRHDQTTYYKISEKHLRQKRDGNATNGKCSQAHPFGASRRCPLRNRRNRSSTWTKFGDHAHFQRLDTARRILLEPRPVQVVINTPAPRISWSRVAQMPAHPFALCIAAILVVLLAALAGLSETPFAITVSASAITAAAWAVWATRKLLSKNADHGHRIAPIALCWLPITSAQVIVSVIFATSFVIFPHLLALPLVAAVAALNPGAGLWRPVCR